MSQRVVDLLKDRLRAVEEQRVTAYWRGFADGQTFAQGEIARLRRICDLLLPAMADMTEQELNDLEATMEESERGT